MSTRECTSGGGTLGERYFRGSGTLGGRYFREWYFGEWCFRGMVL